MPSVRDAGLTLKAVSASLLLFAALSVCGAERESAQCADVWRGQRWRQAEQPIWTSPSLPDRGVVPKLKMWSLVGSDDHPFVPGNIRESNCFLDRILDRTTRSAIKGAGWSLARSGVRDLDKGLHLLLEETARRVGAAIGIEDSSPAGTLSSILTNVQSLYEIRPGPVGDPGPFLKHAYGQRLYDSHTVTWYVLLAYIQHLGARPFDFDGYLRQLRARDSQYAPPESLRADGCAVDIDYKWPHIDSRLPSQTDLPEDAALHFGVCAASRTVWFYVAGKGWSRLTDMQKAEFCSNWSDDEAFARACDPP